MDESQNNLLSKILKNEIYNDRQHVNGYLKGRVGVGKGGIMKGQEKMLQDLGSDHYLHCDDGFMGIDITQNVPNRIL